MCLFLGEFAYVVIYRLVNDIVLNFCNEKPILKCRVSVKKIYMAKLNVFLNIYYKLYFYEQNM